MKHYVPPISLTFVLEGRPAANQQSNKPTNRQGKKNRLGDIKTWWYTIFSDHCFICTGEDGGESSSAGQMETFLGVVSHDNVLEAVRKCWSSAYTYQAVEYRR